MMPKHITKLVEIGWIKHQRREFESRHLHHLRFNTEILRTIDVSREVTNLGPHLLSSVLMPADQGAFLPSDRVRPRTAQVGRPSVARELPHMRRRESIYWSVVKRPNTTGFDPVIHRFKSCQTCHLVLYPLLHTSSDGYSPERPCEEQQGAVDWSPLGRFFYAVVVKSENTLDLKSSDCKVLSVQVRPSVPF